MDDALVHLTPEELEDGGLQWRAWQIRAMWELRNRLPSVVIMANGPWAANFAGWTQGNLVDCVYLEKLGTIWWDIPTAMDKLRQHVQPELPYPFLTHPVSGASLVRESWRGRHVLDITAGPKGAGWNMDQAAQVAAATAGWAWCDNWGRR